MNNKLTKTSSVLQTIGTVTEYLTTRSSIVVFTLMGLFAPFIHLLVDQSAEGVFGWAYMTSFLNAIGWALLPLFLGISMMLEANTSDREYKTAKRIQAFLVVSVGVFYLAYTLIPIKDFTDGQYYTMVSFIAVLGAFLMYFMSKAIKSTEEKLKAIIRHLFHFIIVDTPKNHPNIDIKQYDVEVEEVLAFSAKTV